MRLIPVLLAVFLYIALASAVEVDVNVHVGGHSRGAHHGLRRFFNHPSEVFEHNLNLFKEHMTMFNHSHLHSGFEIDSAQDEEEAVEQHEPQLGAAPEAAAPAVAPVAPVVRRQNFGHAIEFTPCEGSERYPYQISKVFSSVWPITAGSATRFTIQGTAQKQLNAGIISFEAKVFGFTAYSGHDNIPKNLLPIKAGAFTVAKTFTPPKHYGMRVQANVKLADAKHNEIGCVDFELDV